jgi:hypothetical protein
MGTINRDLHADHGSGAEPAFVRGLDDGHHARGDEGQQAPVTSREADSGRWAWHRFAWLPVPLFAAAMLALWAASLPTSYESPEALIGLNFVFSVLVSLFIVYLVGRSFLARGQPGLLMLGCGVIAWGAAGFVGATAGLLGDAGRDFANITVTIHNTSVWLSAACHLAGVTLSFRQRRALRAVRL